MRTTTTKMWNSTFCSSFSALLVILVVVLGSSFILEATAISTNSSSSSQTPEVEGTTADGRNDADSEFKPSSPYFLESPLPLAFNSSTTVPVTTTTAAAATITTTTTTTTTKAPAKLPSARILKRRTFMPMSYPGIVRKFDKEVHKLSQQQHPPPAVLSLFNGEPADKENITSSTVHSSIFDTVRGGGEEEGQQHQQHGELNGDKQTRLYYEDVHRLPTSYQLGGHPQAPASSSHSDFNNHNDQHHHHHHHSNSIPHEHDHRSHQQHHHSPQEHHHHTHNKGAEDTTAEVEHPNHYYPKNLLSKQPPASTFEHVYKAVPEQKHHHDHHHGHYGQQQHHHAQVTEADPHHHHHQAHHHHPHHPHHSHGYSEHGHHSDYRGHSHHHHHQGIGPVIGKALQLLIPSALFITGASALFPNRVYVPTTNVIPTEVIERHRRSAEPDGYVPSMYLKREHRTEEEDYDYVANESRFGERNNPDIMSTSTLPRDSIPIPHFRPMPTMETSTPPPPPPLRPSTSAPLPIVRMSKLEPSGVEQKKQKRIISMNKVKSKQEEYDAFNFEDYAASKEMEPKKLPIIFTPPPGAPRFKFSSRRAPSVLRPVNVNPTYESIKVTPQSSEKIIQSTSVPSVAAVVAKSSPTPTTTTTTTLPPTKETTTTTTTEAPVINNEETNQTDIGDDDDEDIMDTESSYDKPFFRQLSTDRPSMNPVDDEVNSTDVTDVKRREALQNGSRFENRLGANGLQRGGDKSGKTGKPSLFQFGKSGHVKTTKAPAKQAVDLSPGSPVVGLLTNFASRDQDTPACQKRALCELALRGANDKGTKFEKFLWNLANLVPENLSAYYDLEDTFTAVVKRKCNVFKCANPNLDLQEA